MSNLMTWFWWTWTLTRLQDSTIRLVTRSSARAACPEDGLDRSQQRSASREGLRGLFPERLAKNYSSPVFSKTRTRRPCLIPTSAQGFEKEHTSQGFQPENSPRIVEEGSRV